MKFLKVLIIIVILDFCLGIFVTNRQMYRPPKKYYTIFKTVTSFDFMLLGLLIFLYTGSDVYFKFLPGYLFCFLGDFLLAIAKKEDGQLISSRFMAGMGSFSLGHIFYLIQYCGILGDRLAGKGMIIPIMFALFLCVGTMVASRSKYFHYGHKAPYCAAYGAMVGFFGGLGLDMLLFMSEEAYIIMLGIGAFLFMCSDSVLALKYFLIARHEKKKPFGYIELTLYYIAMGLLVTFPLAL